MNTFKTGRLISSRRKEKGLTQTDLANMLQISNRTVSKWENGDGFPDITLLPQICSILEITADELLAGEMNAVEENEEAELLFEATSPTTLKSYKTLFDVHMSRTIPRHFLFIALSCLVILLAVAYVLDAIPSAIILVMLPIILLFALSTLFFSYIMAYTQMKAIRDKNNGQLCDEVVRISDKVKISCGSTVVEMELSQITGLYDRKNLFIIQFGKQHYAYIHKDNFSIGDADSFASFIRSKMTVRKEKHMLKIILTALDVILVSLTIACVILAGIAVANKSADYSYDDYIAMSTSQLEALKDDELYSAISTRVEEKKYYTSLELNDQEKVFFYADNFAVEYECGGFCQYLYNLSDDDIDNLYVALDSIGLDELSAKINKFISDNNINIYDFNSKEDYEELSKRYDFDSFDKSIENDCKIVEINLTEYIRENVKYY